MKKLNLVLSMAAALSLAACGGGSDSSSDSGAVGGDNSGGNDGGDTTAAATVSGKVIDGYIQGATVFLDVNGNGKQEPNEPSAESGENGEYTLELEDADKACLPHAALVVDVPVGAIDEDLGEVGKAYVMTIPPLQGEQFEEVNITPLTTILWSAIKDEIIPDRGNGNPHLACEEFQGNADLIADLQSKMDFGIEQVVSHYNLSEQDIFADYIESGDVENYELAQLIVKGLQKGLEEAQAIEEENPDVSANVSYRKTEDGWVRIEYVFTPQSEGAAGEWSSSAETRSVTNAVSSDLEQIGEQLDFYNRSSYFKTVDSDRIEVATYEESCNDAQTFNYTVGYQQTENTEYEVLNNMDTCGGLSTKSVFVMNWVDKAEDLGEVAQYMVPYNTETSEFGKFDYMKDFVERRDELNLDSILADLGALDASYDDTLDAGALAADYSNVSLKKTVMEGDLKVEYQRQFDNEGGWNYKKTTYQEDGTYTEECKGSADAEWDACES